MTRKRPASAPRPTMSNAQRGAVTAELTRLILGGRPERPELVPTRLEVLDYLRTSNAR